MEGAFGRPPHARKPWINITPLVDVMLLLLIFFMVTASFRDMRALDVTLPEAVSGAEVTSPPPLEITVGVDGTIALDGVAATLEELRDRLLANPEEALVLRADKQTPYAFVVRVLDVVRSTGATNIVLPVAPMTETE